MLLNVSDILSWSVSSVGGVTFMPATEGLGSDAAIRSYLRLSSVTFVHPTQAIEIFGNVCTPFGTLAIHDLCIKVLRRSSQGNPSVGGS